MCDLQPRHAAAYWRDDVSWNAPRHRLKRFERPVSGSLATPEFKAEDGSSLKSWLAPRGHICSIVETDGPVDLRLLMGEIVLEGWV